MVLNKVQKLCCIKYEIDTWLKSCMNFLDIELIPNYEFLRINFRNADLDR